MQYYIRLSKHQALLLVGDGTLPKLGESWFTPSGARLYYCPSGYHISGYASDGRDILSDLELIFSRMK